MPKPPHPLWVADAARRIVDRVDEWLSHSAAEAQRVQDHQAGDDFLHRQIADAILDAWMGRQVRA